MSYACIIQHGNRSCNSSCWLSPCSQDKLSLALDRVELQAQEATFFQKETNDKVLLIKVQGSESVLAENPPLPCGTEPVAPAFSHVCLSGMTS